MFVRMVTNGTNSQHTIMKTSAIISLKGDVGKTSVAAVAVERQGLRNHLKSRLENTGLLGF